MADIEKKELDSDLEKNSADVSAGTENKSDKKDKNQKSKSAKKAKKPSIGSRILAWMKSTKSELKKIVWASPKSVLTNSLMVIVTIVIVAVVIGLLDLALTEAIIGLGKLF